MRYFLLTFLFSIQVLAQSTLDSGQNILKNGGIEIWQRGTSFAAAANNSFSADGWKYNFSSNTGVVTISKSTSPTGRYNPSLKVDTTTADASIGASEYATLTNFIEGNDIKGILGKYVTVAFYVYSTVTGKAPLNIQNNAANRNLVVDYEIFTTNTWEEKYVTFYFDPTGTWETDEDFGIRLRWTLACGSDFDDATSGVWGTTNEICTADSASFNQLSSTDNDFAITDVRVYAGTQKKPFVRAGGTYAGELDLAQRYYFRNVGAGTPTELAGVALCGYSTNAMNFCGQTPVTMRSVPTCGLGGSATTDWDVVNASGTGQSFTSQTSGARNTLNSYTLQANKTSHGLTFGGLLLKTVSGYVECSAEY